MCSQVKSIPGHRNDQVVQIGTNRSCGVITLIGQNVEFTVKDIVQDDKGRYLILCSNIQVSQFLLVNLYASNVEIDQILFLSIVKDVIVSLCLEATIPIIIGGDLNCHLQSVGAEDGLCKAKKDPLYKLRV